MTKRSLPRWSELRPLLQMQQVPLDPVERRLARCHTVADLREAARRRVPRAVFDFVDGAAEGEVSLARSRAAFDRVEFAPAALAGFDEVSTATTILGTPSALPLVLAPTGFTRLSHRDGEAAVAAAAAEAGIPYALTTMSTVSIEDVAAASGDGTRWFQLYLMRDRGLTRELVRRAKDAGYRALVVTVDTPVVGQRVRDLHNGLTIPPTLTPRTLRDISRRPQWWGNLLTTEPLEFATLQAGEPEAHSTLIDRLFDPAVTVEDFAPLREW